jgi:hypothetical protein
MEFAQAEEQVKTIGSQLVVAQMQVETLTRTVAGLRKILDAYVEMFPELLPFVEGMTQGISPADDEDGRPRGAEAVRLILQESPNEWFRVSELVGLLRDRGWLPESENPANAVRTALERLVSSIDESDVVRGKYTTGPRSGAVVYKYDPDRDRTEKTGGYGFDEEPF